jgi:AmiR/NasT family two-component response regulator
VASVSDDTVQRLLDLNSHLLQRAEQLEAALESRVVIEQAKGVLAARHGLEISAAFDVMRRAARANELKLHGLATRVVAERRTPVEIVRFLG